MQWVVIFNIAKSGKRSNIYGPFATSELARCFAVANVEVDEVYEIVALGRVKCISTSRLAGVAMSRQRI
jgi:hypothetical protein